MQPKGLLKRLKPTDTVERCGLVLSGGRVIKTQNVAANTVMSFEIPPEEMIKPGRTVVGTWHTHPGQPANLSHEDYAGFLNWPELTHWIVGTDGVRGYKVDNGLVLNLQ